MIDGMKIEMIVGMNMKKTRVGMRMKKTVTTAAIGLDPRSLPIAMSLTQGCKININDKATETPNNTHISKVDTDTNDSKINTNSNSSKADTNYAISEADSNANAGEVDINAR
jgi:hypothetical protein